MPADIVDISSGHVIGPAGEVVANDKGVADAAEPDMPGIPAMAPLPASAEVDDALVIAVVPRIATSDTHAAAKDPLTVRLGDVSSTNTADNTTKPAASSIIVVSRPT